MELTALQERNLADFIAYYPDDKLIRLYANHKYLNDTGLNSTYPKRFTIEESIAFEKLAEKEFYRRKLSEITLDEYYKEANVSDKSDTLTIQDFPAIRDIVDYDKSKIKSSTLGIKVFWGLVIGIAIYLMFFHKTTRMAFRSVS